MIKSVRASKTTVYLVLVGIAALLALADHFPHSIEPRLGITALTDQLEDSYALYKSGAIGGPFVYRLFIPWFIELTRQVSGASILMAFSFANFIFCALALVAMSVYSRASFSQSTRIASIATIAAYILLTQTQMPGVTLFEGQDALNLAVMLFGMHLILRRKFWWLALLIPVGIINRETPLFLLIPMIYIGWKEHVWKPVALTVILSVGSYIGIRLLVNNPGGAEWFLFDKMSKNIPGLNSQDLGFALKSNVYVLLYFIPVLALFFVGKKLKSVDFKGILLMSACFILAHYMVGTIIELRLFLPLIGVLLPFAFGSYFEEMKLRKKQKIAT